MKKAKLFQAAKTVTKQKSQNIYVKAQSEIAKIYFLKTTFETLKHQKQTTFPPQLAECFSHLTSLLPFPLT